MILGTFESYEMDFNFSISLLYRRDIDDNFDNSAIAELVIDWELWPRLYLFNRQDLMQACNKKVVIVITTIRFYYSRCVEGWKNILFNYIPLYIWVSCNCITWNYFLSQAIIIYRNHWEAESTEQLFHFNLRLSVCFTELTQNRTSYLVTSNKLIRNLSVHISDFS